MRMYAVVEIRDNLVKVIHLRWVAQEAMQLLKEKFEDALGDLHTDEELSERLDVLEEDKHWTVGEVTVQFIALDVGVPAPPKEDCTEDLAIDMGCSILGITREQLAAIDAEDG